VLGRSKWFLNTKRNKNTRPPPPPPTRGIRTRHPRNRADADLRLRPHGHGGRICNVWNINKNWDKCSSIALQMAYLRSVKGCTRLDCFRSGDVRWELNVIPIPESIDRYSKWWWEHLLRIGESGFAKIAVECNIKSRRDMGCPRKRSALWIRNRQRA
jgi:hypothetical protein